MKFKNLKTIFFNSLLLLFALLSCEEDNDTDITSIVMDVDGNSYKTVKIGSQTWMAENLKTTHFNDGTSIELVSQEDDWYNTESPAYCWYDNNKDLYKESYGALYNYYTVYNGNLCPDGWHVPTDEEWKQLEMELGMSIESADSMNHRGTNTAYKLKSTSGWFENSNGSNSSGFNALPAGYRYKYGGFYDFFGKYAKWWTSTKKTDNLIYTRGLGYQYNYVNRFDASKSWGLSVRCIKNNY